MIFASGAACEHLDEAQPIKVALIERLLQEVRPQLPRDPNGARGVTPPYSVLEITRAACISRGFIASRE